MLNNEKISIIVPVYNIEKYLSRCLDSIINQTYKNLEIIVISDGSVDGSNEIIRSYAAKDKRIVPVFKDNSGVSETRNVGLDKATGEYIGFVDGDDYIEPNMYETLLKNAIENNADISHCGYQMVFPSRVDYYYNTGKKVLQDKEKGIYDLITGEYIEPGIVIKLYKKSVLKNVRMEKGLIMTEDLLFNFKAFCNAEKSYYEDIPLYHYIIRENSASTMKDNYKTLANPVYVSERMLEGSKNYSEEIYNAAYKRVISMYIGIYRTINMQGLTDLKKLQKEVKEKLKKNKSKIGLTKKICTEKFLIEHCPMIYMLVYKLYDRFISKSSRKYEVK